MKTYNITLTNQEFEVLRQLYTWTKSAMVDKSFHMAFKDMAQKLNADEMEVWKAVREVAEQGFDAVGCLDNINRT